LHVGITNCDAPLPPRLCEACSAHLLASITATPSSHHYGTPELDSRTPLATIIATPSSSIVNHQRASFSLQHNHGSSAPHYTLILVHLRANQQPQRSTQTEQLQQPSSSLHGPWRSSTTTPAGAAAIAVSRAAKEETWGQKP